MQEISLEMVCDHMDHLPFYPCPGDYRIRTYVRGNERPWAKIETEAGEFANQEQALEQVGEEFRPFLSEMEDRCFFLEDSHGEAIGTCTAWYGHFAGEARGRVHWMGIVPSHQGRKLSKPLLSAVMARLAQDHQKAYLDTQTTSYQAVNLYLSFGFVPYLGNDSSIEGWLLMEQILQRKIL